MVVYHAVVFYEDFCKSVGRWITYVWELLGAKGDGLQHVCDQLLIQLKVLLIPRIFFLRTNLLILRHLFPQLDFVVLGVLDLK